MLEWRAHLRAARELFPANVRTTSTGPPAQPCSRSSDSSACSCCRSTGPQTTLALSYDIEGKPCERMIPLRVRLRGQGRIWRAPHHRGLAAWIRRNAMRFDVTCSPNSAAFFAWWRDAALYASGQVQVLP